jgi:hypothetical protein
MTLSTIVFDIKNEDLDTFHRLVRKPKDFAINALQLLHVLDQKCADLLRITVGDIGITENQFLDILAYRYQNYRFKFYPITLYDLILLARDYLEINKTILCSTTNHIFFLAKNYLHQIFYIDPTLQIYCNITEQSCLNKIQSFSSFSILKGKQTSP